MSMAANLIIACVCVFCGYCFGVFDERMSRLIKLEAERANGPAEEEAAT